MSVGLQLRLLRRSTVLLAACVFALPGCRSISGAAGGLAGAASGTASANPAVGVAVGLGVKAAVNAVISAALRRWSDEEQGSIALQVGAMAPGERRRWEVRHAVPYDDKQGQVTVVRAFETPLASCKEAVFTVSAADNGSAVAEHFVATVCQGSDGWKWAVAEPSVLRWGALQ